MMEKRRRYREVSDIELSPELDQKVRAMTELADQQVAEAQVTFRWGKAQLATVKRAAKRMGVPYQTYIKQAVFRQALADLRDSASVAEPGRPTGQERDERAPAVYPAQGG